MKALLNFLPSEHRQEVRKNLIALVISNFTTFLVILFAVFGASLYGIQFLFKQEIARIETEQKTVESRSGSSENTDIEEAIKSLNALTARLDAIQKQQIYWSLGIERLFSIIPTGISLDGINLKSGDKTAVISGYAKTRESYYALERALQESPYIASSDVPISLQKNDIQFSITLNLTENFFTYETGS